MILNAYNELGIDTLVEHINEEIYYQTNLIDTLWQFASEKDDKFKEQINYYNDNKNSMPHRQALSLYDDLVNDAMNILGYKWDDYFKEWEKLNK